MAEDERGYAFVVNTRSVFEYGELADEIAVGGGTNGESTFGSLLIERGVGSLQRLCTGGSKTSHALPRATS